MKELDYWSYIESKGYAFNSKMHSIYGDIFKTFMSYQYAYTFVKGSAQEEIESSKGPGMHLIIEPIILPSISNSLFIAMYGEFEGYLNQICKVHGEINNYSLNIKDIAGNGIERAVTYLEKVVGLDGIKKSSGWNTLQFWNKVRNILIHNNGVMKEPKEQTAVKKLKLNIEDKYNKVFLTIDDCERFHTLIVKFFRLCI